MRLTGETKFFLGIITATIAIIIVAVTLFSRPTKPLSRQDLIAPGTNTQGNPNAEHYLVEFSDFQCPACKVFSQHVEALAKAYPDTLLIAYRHFPLPQHTFSKKAALAAELAAKEGKFWETASVLFANQEQFTEDEAKNMDLVISLVKPFIQGTESFASDLRESHGMENIDRDIAYGEQIGISATPTFFLDGVKVDLSTPADLTNKVQQTLGNPPTPSPVSIQQIKEEPMNTQQPTSSPSSSVDVNKTYTAILHTEKGDITIALSAKETPKTVNNFVTLAKKKFYDNTIFHRVIKDFMIQGGDPKGDGTGGPGYRFDDEPFTGDYTRGTVAMANAGPNTNGSQFFVMHKDTGLPKNYVIFGQVTKGLDVVDAIATAPVTVSPSGEQSKPITPVRVQSIDIVEE